MTASPASRASHVRRKPVVADKISYLWLLPTHTDNPAAYAHLTFDFEPDADLHEATLHLSNGARASGDDVDHVLTDFFDTNPHGITCIHVTVFLNGKQSHRTEIGTFYAHGSEPDPYFDN